MSKLTKGDQNIANELAKRRSNKGFSTAHLAREVGVSPRQWNKYETGRNRIPVTRLTKFCKLCGITVDQFLKDAKL